MIASATKSIVDEIYAESTILPLNDGDKKTVYSHLMTIDPKVLQRECRLVEQMDEDYHIIGYRERLITGNQVYKMDRVAAFIRLLMRYDEILKS